MIAKVNAPCFTLPIAELQQRFLAIQPRLELHATICFRSVKCPGKKADYVAECIAIAWRWFLRLIEQGKDPTSFASVLAGYAARAVRSGRRLCGMLKAKDAMNELTQQRRGFQVASLSATTRRAHADLYGAVGGQRRLDTLEEMLVDHSRSSPAEQASFRIDFAGFMRSLTQRDRALAKHLAVGNSNKQTARRFRLSAGRVSQVRRRLCKHWFNMHGEPAPFERRQPAAEAR